MGGDNHVVVGDSAQMDVEESGATMSVIVAKMYDTEQKLSRVEELESRCTSLEDTCNSLEDKCNSLERRNNVLVARCGSLERCVEIMMKAQKWEYSVPPIPRNHWVERGLDEDDIDRAESFADSIMDITCDLRKGDVCDDKIYLGGGVHDDLLLPHWREFADALHLLHLSQDKHLSLDFTNVTLESSVLRILTPALKGPLRSLELQRNYYTDIGEGVGFAVETIKGNNLEEFAWRNNRMEHIDDVHYLVRAITSHPSIEKVRLEDCIGENINGYDVLRSLFTADKKFKHIDLKGNNIQTDGGTEIPDFIAMNPPLETLYLADNNLNDNDAILIARALKKNTNIRCLRLGGRNNITKIGFDALANAIYDFTSLNAAYNCNHTCKLGGLDFGNQILMGIIDLWMNLGGRPYARAGKMMHLMSLGNIEGSNVHRLNLEFKDEDDEYSLALVPMILESVHRYFDITRDYWSAHNNTYVPPLSIMYEILSSWKMPELFETSRTTKQTNSKHK